MLALAMGAVFASEALLEFNGYVGLELRGFPQTALDPAQRDASVSVFAKPEVYASWDDGRQSARFVPFARWDSSDDERSHWDVREAFWERVGEHYAIKIGLDRVFWGVIESQHLVDFINQTDLVENVDTEDKLGQPMVNLTLMRDWGTLDLFVLPGFRERTFPGRHGRLRTQPRVDTSRTTYESSLEQAHVDFAARWSHVIGEFDIGLYQFYGTSRDPTLLPALTPSGQPVLVPRYDIVHQTGLDLQLTREAWLWKLEALYRAGQGDDFVASSAGFEYTMVGVLDTAIDVGWLGEYHFDSEGDGNALHFADDLFAGLRLTFNDVQSTQLLAGVLFDRTGSGSVASLEASRRLGETWKAELEARFFNDFDASDPRAGLRNDDYVQLSVLKHF